MESREGLLDKLRHSDEVSITVTGRKTKKSFSTPVWFVLEGESKVLLVPMKGSDSAWFKDLATDPQIRLSIGGAAISSRVSIGRDPKEVEGVLDKFRSKYRSMWSESYYTKRDVCVRVPL